MWDCHLNIWFSNFFSIMLSCIQIPNVSCLWWPSFWKIWVTFKTLSLGKNEIKVWKMFWVYVDGMFLIWWLFKISIRVSCGLAMFISIFLYILYFFHSSFFLSFYLSFFLSFLSFFVFLWRFFSNTNKNNTFLNNTFLLAGVVITLRV